MLEAIQKKHGRTVTMADHCTVFCNNMDFHFAIFGLCAHPAPIEVLRNGRLADLVRRFTRLLQPSRDACIHSYEQSFGR